MTVGDAGTTCKDGPPRDSRQRHIVLTGYMGTGKSSVGQAVAERLGRPFVDMDELIAQRAGMSIAELFRTRGESAFREYECALCADLAQQEGLVIATGGGALVNAENREVMASSGLLICLDCEAEELLRRLQGDAGRPMLWGDDPEQRLHELLGVRRPAYAEIPHHIDTTARTLEQVVDEVLRLVAAEPVLAHVTTPGGGYQVQIVEGGLRGVGALLRVRGITPGVVIVTDEHVWPLYGQQLQDGLESSGYNPTAIVLLAGEEHKTLDTVRLLYDRFAEASLDRSAAVLALGGGVITDMAGFAAATFMRGVSFVPLPTTLLGMVDAAIGGKVAVDHPRGKNLIGAFSQPLFVMLDPATLATLPDLERRTGLAEVIKAGIIADADLFVAFEARGAEANLRWAVERALAVKIAIVERDPYETGERAVLNLGHTFAHAFEVLSGYSLHHGLAVSVGMAAAAHLAAHRGDCSSATRQRIIRVLQRHDLPTSYDAHPPDVVYQAMRSDKKRRASRLRFVLPRDIGTVFIADDVSREEVLHALERIRP